MLENCKRLICSPSLNKVYCIVLYCIVLYCIVLYCIVLYHLCRKTLIESSDDGDYLHG